MLSDAQLAANRANAQLSTGPTSEDGKTTSSKNALKTGLTGRTVLLPTDDAALYEAHVAHFEKLHAPSNDAERNLVQALADTEWRLARIPSLEAGIYALGRLEFAELFPQEPEPVRKQLIEAKIFLAYGRQLNNLSIQENRLRRQREKDLAALKQLQDDRKRERESAKGADARPESVDESAASCVGAPEAVPVLREFLNTRLDKAAWQYVAAVHEQRHEDFDPIELGFEFSLDEIELRAMDLDKNLFADYERQLAEERKIA